MTSIHKICYTLLIMALSMAVPNSIAGHADAVQIEILSDDRGPLREYRVDDHGSSQRSYIAVRDGEHYRIRVNNRSSERIGLVIAVDGRNIIDGKKSWLKHQEAKYVLGPWESAEYEGWRTSRHQVNRFYFTSADDSYAEAWGDHSAMGVIAVAVFAEKRPPRYTHDEKRIGKGASAARHAMEDSMGTGFGEGHWSPSRTVSFRPRKHPLMKKFIKYETRRSLCRRGVIDDCHRPHEHNRFWPDNDFAPFPWQLKH